jgi:Na+-transporting NADH:ubiquinone oxidoreductase subunit C
MKNKLATMILFVLVLGTILTVSLVAVNYYTEPIIRRNAEITVKSNVLEALGIPFGREETEEVFSRSVEEKRAGERRFYITRQGEIAFPFSGPGLWGPISGVIAVLPDLATLKGITIIHQEETPGLGSRITEESYLRLFENRKFTPRLKPVAAGKSGAENEIDSITGATMTSNAFIDILNQQLEENLAALKGAAQ